MTTMKRRQWLGKTAGALGFATLAPQTQANSGAPRVVTVESALRPVGFGLPQRAAFAVNGMAHEAQIDAAHNAPTLTAQGVPVRRLGAKPANVHATDFLNMPIAVAYNPVSQTLWVACADAKLHRFDVHGQWLASSGNASDQPGHCMGVGGLAVDASGQVWVADPVLGLVHVFAANGDFTSRHTLRHGLTGYWQPRGLRVAAHQVQVWVTPDHSRGFAVCRECQTTIA